MPVFDESKIATSGFARAPNPRPAAAAAPPPPPPDDEEEEADEEDGTTVGALPPVETYVAPPVPEPKPRESQSRQGVGNVGVIEGKKKWVHTEADLLWGEMLAYLSAAKRSPYEFGIAITRHDEQSNRLANIDGGTVLGSPPNTGPGEALLNAVINRIHIPSGVQTPMHYRCIFYVKRTSTVFGIGHIQLPAVSEIMQMRRAQFEAAATNPPQAYYPQPPSQGYGPGAAQPAPQQQYPQVPQTYYPPQPQQPQGLGSDPAVVQLLQELASIRAESAYQRGIVDEVMRAGREGRQPDPSRAPAPPPPAPAPPAGVGGISEDVLNTIVTRVVNAMGGPRPQAPQPAPAPPPAPAPTPVAAGMGGIADMIQQTMVASLSRVVQMGAAQMERNVAESLRGAAGLGAPPVAAEADDEEPPEVVPQEDPRDALPFRAIEMNQTWGDGRKVVYAKDLESGQPTVMGANVMGVLMTNPFLIEKLSEGMNAIMVQGAEAIKRVTTSSIGARAPQPAPGFGAPPQAQRLQAPAPQQAPPPPVQQPAPGAAPEADTVKRAVQSGWEA
jgi:hypothetical protein